MGFHFSEAARAGQSRETGRGMVAASGWRGALGVWWVQLQFEKQKRVLQAEGGSREVCRHLTTPNCRPKDGFSGKSCCYHS